MKKSLPFNVLSEKVCSAPKCGRRLKLRIALEHPEVAMCFQCIDKKKRAEQGMGYPTRMEARKRRQKKTNTMTVGQRR